VKLLVTLWLALSCGHHQHQHQKGAMNEKFLSPSLNASQWDQDFSNEQRDVIAHRESIIDALELRPGSRVADVGAGTGVFLKSLSLKVGKHGKVYGVDISPRFVDYMQDHIEKDQLFNALAVLGKPTSTTLPKNTIDTILVVDTYHHFDKPRVMLEDFQNILKTNGRLAIVDFNRTASSRQWIKDHVKKNKKQYIDEIEAAGFRLISEPNIPFKENFMLIFEKGSK
jgi:ubiquinone/menaquinone biosynthesis C-methylase UbiE